MAMKLIKQGKEYTQLITQGLPLRGNKEEVDGNLI